MGKKFLCSKKKFLNLEKFSNAYIIFPTPIKVVLLSNESILMCENEISHGFQEFTHLKKFQMNCKFYAHNKCSKPNLT